MPLEFDFIPVQSFSPSLPGADSCRLVEQSPIFFLSSQSSEFFIQWVVISYKRLFAMEDGRIIYLRVVRIPNV